MKISIITWDGNFRESDHTIRFFADQDFPKSDYEMIWVDFFQSSKHIREVISRYDHVRLLTLDRPHDEPWHLGVCINAGVESSSGELLVISDGDIAVDRGFLQYVWESHRYQRDLALYFRRFDEIRENPSKEPITILGLKENSRLTNPINFGGCLALRRENFDRVKGYETHKAFSRSGCQGLELHVRLRNAGMAVKWAPDKEVYHPWHSGTGHPLQSEQDALRMARYRYSWIIPYAGLEQSWIVNCREFSGRTLADPRECDELLKKMPKVDLRHYRNLISVDRKDDDRLKMIIKKARKFFKNAIPVRQ